MKTKLRFFNAAVALMFIAIGFTACYPGDDVSYSDLDLLITDYDVKTNFASLSTYYMPDSVVHLKDTLDPSSNVDVSHDLDDFVLQKVRANMSAYGYTAEAEPSIHKPDIFLTVSVMATKNYNVYYYYPYYWGWGWGWYYKSTDYWGWYYPPGWGGTYVTSYTVGTLVMTMHDIRNATATTDTIPTIWTGAMNGLLGSSSSATKNRVEYNIDQAFTQSPYLKIN
jgi:hypothetical protein